MSTKTLIMILMSMGSIVGSYLPVLFGVDVFSLWSIVWGAVGGITGIWIGWKLGNF